MPDFAYSPDFNYTVEPEFNVLRTRFENNVEQRRLKTSQKLRKYSLQFQNRRTTEMNAVISFYESKFGSLDSFSISIEDEDVTGVIVPGSFKYSRVAPSLYSYQFDFEEVL